MNGLVTNMVMLVSKKVRYRGRLITAKLGLVVAARLHRVHTQFSSISGTYLE
jgi:hypothetical protein